MKLKLPLNCDEKDNIIFITFKQMGIMVAFSMVTLLQGDIY